MSLNTRRITYAKYKRKAAENTSPSEGLVLFSEGPEINFLIYFFKKLGDPLSFFVLDLSLLNSGLSAACVVRNAWEKVCEF